MNRLRVNPRRVVSGLALAAVALSSLWLTADLTASTSSQASAGKTFSLESADGAARELPIADKPITIGRHPTNMIVLPDGSSVMIDRGVRRVDNASGDVTYQLHGNGWRFPAGHRVRVEIAQDDDPFVRASI